jgi:DNA-binding LacI/PurR family transcriptional regulator
VAEELGYDILLSATAPIRNERAAVEALLSHRCEGLILLGPNLEPGYVTDLAHRIPTVVVGRRFAGAGVDAVHAAEAQGVRQVIDYLVELGHSAIVHIDGGNGPGSAERRRAYRAVLRRHGLGEHARVLPGDHTEESGTRAAQALLGEDTLPTAVFAGNDRCAVGFLDAVLRVGLDVPGHLSRRLRRQPARPTVAHRPDHGGAKPRASGRTRRPSRRHTPRRPARPAPLTRQRQAHQHGFGAT